MPQDKTIKGVMERFREKFGNCSTDKFIIFLQQEIKLALESVVPEERNTPHTEPIPELKGHHIGYNQAINEIKENIKHYLE